MDLCGSLAKTHCQLNTWTRHLTLMMFSWPSAKPASKQAKLIQYTRQHLLHSTAASSQKNKRHRSYNGFAKRSGQPNFATVQSDCPHPRMSHFPSPQTHLELEDQQVLHGSHLRCLAAHTLVHTTNSGLGLLTLQDSDDSQEQHSSGEC